MSEQDIVEKAQNEIAVFERTSAQTSSVLIVECLRLRAENAELRERLRDCADDLEAEIKARYPNGAVTYPSEYRRYRNDMLTVDAARQALGGSND